MVTGYESNYYRNISNIDRQLERIAIALEKLVDQDAHQNAPRDPPDTSWITPPAFERLGSPGIARQ